MRYLNSVVHNRGILRFAATELTTSELALQAEVREFLDHELPCGTHRPGLGFNAPADREFSRKLGARGWLGMALPRAYGGGERTAVERFVITEELLSRGAPVGHHWVADRQSGSVIARFGTDEQKAALLPGICAGELGFSIGMSEPDAGSDLAAVRTRATRADGGWTINGAKVWTTGAHRNDFMIALCRTDDSGDRHAGLTQFIVDLSADGVQVNPIPFIDGTHEFNEVVLDDVFVSDSRVLGDVGQGWSQNTAELAFERGGPDRYLSTYPVVEQFLREAAAASLGADAARFLGRVTATWWVLRNLSLAIARAIDEGDSPVQEAALVKEIGTRFEQDLLIGLQELIDIEPSPDSRSLFEQILCEAILTAPSNTIRGGTTEILLSVAAKGLAR
jgi:alkylation response protein AidB-like acyl-CoA dehydrogenase